MEWLTYIFFFFLGLSLLVIVHELGHFIPAKLFGMRVERFFIFFDWPTALWSFRYKETVYGIGVLPLGGYVKIAGMVDESLDTEHLQLPPKPWEFRAKPTWQRLIVMAGGVTMNALLAVIIFACFHYFLGTVQTPIKQLPYGIDVYPGSPAEQIGLKTGDIPIALNGKPITYLEEIQNAATLALEDQLTITVVRDGDTLTIEVPPARLRALREKLHELPALAFYPNPPAYVSVVDSSYPAAKAGIQPGDKILAINGEKVESFGHLRTLLKKYKENDTLHISVERKNQVFTFSVVLNKEKKLGVAPDFSKIPTVRVRYSLGRSIWEGCKSAVDVLVKNYKGFRQMIRGELEVGKNLAGPIRIAKVFKQQYERGGWLAFWHLVAMFSVILAFVNLLPIPALDGGHIVFLLVEMVIRRPVPDKVRIAAQQIGLIILLILTALILINDILNF